VLTNKVKMIEQVWNDFLNIVRVELGSRIVETWFKAVTFSQYDIETKRVQIAAPNSFVKEWIQKHYKNLFDIHLCRLLHVDSIIVEFIDSSQNIDSAADHNNKISFAPAIRDRQKERSFAGKSFDVAAKKEYSLAPHFNNTQLNPLYTFDSFVVGESNSFAYSSARAVTDKLGKLYNPLLFYGESGLGKTHLLHAIGNAALQANPKAIILYQTTDRFITEFINAIRFNHVNKFQDKYKNIDVLLVDDIQFMRNKEQTQEMFFHIFNHLYDKKKQIVFSSDVLPRDLGGLEKRLQSRLEWGLVADIHMPMLETKIAILKKKAEVQNETISDEVAHYIAKHMFSSIRELEGALIRILAFSALTQQPITIELVQKVLGYMIESTQKIIGFDNIVNIIEKHFSYSLKDLQSKDRSKEISLARQICMYFMKQKSKKSLKDIGEYFGRKDHTTITYAIQKIDQMIKEDHLFAKKIELIERDLS
jgi:chromosomal replication initiator protein